MAFKGTGIIDVDGVLANLVDGLAEYGEKPVYTDKMFPFSEYDEEELETIFNTPEFFNSLKPYTGVSDAIKYLKGLGYFILIVSARHILEFNTMSWLTKNDIPFDKFIRVGNKDRVKLAKDINPEFYVDDTFENILLSPCKNALLMDRPWNQLYNPDIIRIDSLTEVPYYLGERSVED